MNAEDIRRLVADSVALKQQFFAASAGQLVELGGRMAVSLNAGGTRARRSATAARPPTPSTSAAELVGRFSRERRGLPAIALTTDPSVVTAVGNDMGFAAVFRRQVEAHGQQGRRGRRHQHLGPLAERDRRPRRAPARAGLVTVGLTGAGGGQLRGLVDHLIDVPQHRHAAGAGGARSWCVHLLCQIDRGGG